MNKGKKTNKSKHYEKLMAGFLVITLLGLLILLVSMYRHDKANALVYARETTDFLKDSCDRYDNTILDNSSTASEMVRETAETLASCATSTQLTDTGYLTNYASSQKMSGILILDENMNLVKYWGGRRLSALEGFDLSYKQKQYCQIPAEILYFPGA